MYYFRTKCHFRQPYFLWATGIVFGIVSFENAENDSLDDIGLWCYYKHMSATEICPDELRKMNYI